MFYINYIAWIFLFIHLFYETIHTAPKFVGSALIPDNDDRDDDKVYFFFTEREVDAEGVNRAVYTRIGRVCAVRMLTLKRLGRRQSVRASVDCQCITVSSPRMIKADRECWWTDGAPSRKLASSALWQDPMALTPTLMNLVSLKRILSQLLLVGKTFHG